MSILEEIDDRLKIFYILEKAVNHISSQEISDRLLQQGENVSPKSVTNILRGEPKNKVRKKYSDKNKGKPLYKLMNKGETELKQKLKEKTEILERVYPENTTFDFYTDLKRIIERKNPNEVFLIEPFCHKELIDLYLSKAKNSRIKFLTNISSAQKKSCWKKTNPIAKKLKRQNKNFQVRANKLIHDRILFLDYDAWIIGSSLKDAAKKPTYLVKLRIENQRLKKIYERLWKNSKKLL